MRAFITHYREDPDQQNLIDWIQEDWLQCCGIDGPNDWDNNNYFNCSSLAVGSREACGVPFSCCKRLPNEIIRNKQCGYDVRRETHVRWIFLQFNFVKHLLNIYTFYSQSNDISRTINEKGCVQAGEEWVERNLIIISSTVIFLAFMQVCFDTPFFPTHLFTIFCSHSLFCNQTILHTANFFPHRLHFIFRFWVYVLRKICMQIFLLKSQNGDELLHKIITATD